MPSEEVKNPRHSRKKREGGKRARIVIAKITMSRKKTAISQNKVSVPILDRQERLKVTKRRRQDTGPRGRVAGEKSWEQSTPERKTDQDRAISWTRGDKPEVQRELDNAELAKPSKTEDKQETKKVHQTIIQSPSNTDQNAGYLPETYSIKMTAADLCGPFQNGIVMVAQEGLRDWGHRRLSCTSG